MPVGPYPDFDSCVRDNQDKQNPEGYCAELERNATGANMTTHVALIAPEEVLTSDDRFFQAGSWFWRDNLPLMFIDRTTPGHDDAVHVGNATNIRRMTVEGQTWIVGDVTYDGDENAREAQRLADEGKLAGISADYTGLAEVEVVETDEDGIPIRARMTYSEAELLGFTQLPMPAFAGARIMTRPEFEALTRQAMAAAANPRARRDWFTDPQLPGPTPLTVTDEGRVFGHLATWGTCHIGYDGVCVTPPESATSYKYFNLGCVNIDGEDIPCGHITLGTGHAQLSAGADDAARHYDNTGSVAADVVAGEDEHGIWVSGAVRPGVDVDVLRSASLSGDWRRVDGTLELVAALAVNVPGFPIPRIAASVAHGDQMALVASGVVEHREREDLIYEALRLIHQEIKALRSEPAVVLKPGEYNLNEALELNGGRVAGLIGEPEPIAVVSDGDTITDLNTGETRPDETGMKGRLAALLDQ